MKMPGRFLTFVAPVAVVLWLTLMPGNGATAEAQEPVPANASADNPDWHFGFEMFRMLLEEQGLQPVTDANSILNHPDESVVVIMGRIENVVPPRTIERFCERGGTVLLAGDTHNSFGRIGEFVAGPVTTRQTEDRYQDFPDCLSVVALDRSHPLLENVYSLVVNRSGWLQHPRWFIPDWTVIARLPADVSPADASSAALIAQVNVSASATGQLIMAADQSLFTNGMLWHGDNAILAVNISQQLSAGNRSRLLFVQDETVVGSYQNSPALSSPSPPPQLPANLPEPDLETMLRMMNTVVREVEESNVVNEGLANRPRNLRAPYYWRGLLLALVTAASVLFLWKLTATGPVVHRAMPQRMMKTAHALTTDRRMKAAEFGLAASLLSRELCRELTGSQDSSEWHRLLNGNEASDLLPLRKKSQQKQLAAVLDLALNSRTVHISRQRFQFIGRSIQQLRQLHRERQQIS